MDHNPSALRSFIKSKLSAFQNDHHPTKPIKTHTSSTHDEMVPTSHPHYSHPDQWVMFDKTPSMLALATYEHANLKSNTSSRPKFTNSRLSSKPGRPKMLNLEHIPPPLQFSTSKSRNNRSPTTPITPSPTDQRQLDALVSLTPSLSHQHHHPHGQRPHSQLATSKTPKVPSAHDSGFIRPQTSTAALPPTRNYSTVSQRPGYPSLLSAPSHASTIRRALAPTINITNTSLIIDHDTTTSENKSSQLSGQRHTSCRTSFSNNPSNPCYPFFNPNTPPYAALPPVPPMPNLPGPTSNQPTRSKTADLAEARNIILGLQLQVDDLKKQQQLYPPPPQSAQCLTKIMVKAQSLQAFDSRPENSSLNTSDKSLFPTIEPTTKESASPRIPYRRLRRTSSVPSHDLKPVFLSPELGASTSTQSSFASVNTNLTNSLNASMTSSPMETKSVTLREEERSVRSELVNRLTSNPSLIELVISPKVEAKQADPQAPESGRVSQHLRSLNSLDSSDESEPSPTWACPEFPDVPCSTSSRNQFGLSITPRAEMRRGETNETHKIELALLATNHATELENATKKFKREKEALLDQLAAAQQELRSERQRVQDLELENARAEERENKMARELKRAVVELRSASKLITSHLSAPGKAKRMSSGQFGTRLGIPGASTGPGLGIFFSYQGESKGHKEAGHMRHESELEKRRPTSEESRLVAAKEAEGSMQEELERGISEAVGGGGEAKKEVDELIRLIRKRVSLYASPPERSM
ncbi:hypothetical protein CROQUDRAFT_649854 [Cronartium quercuum f. sp. fusiforme G11]|uniref:Uncharacterized protein n=1 Tax=Cronartium quercuum f. sp. fusiforme G11 TaxID=708437 RepID=A0A9P6TH48_9BASI|nr:hypothetical protein CROQUDRAFT_649854 [Cronartium quercuum f. sp. fusiforme G11]